MFYHMPTYTAVCYGSAIKNRGPAKHRALPNVTTRDMPVTVHEMKSTVVPLLPQVYFLLCLDKD